MEAGVTYINSLFNCTTIISRNSTNTKNSATKNKILLISKNNFKHFLDKKMNINKIKNNKIYLNKNPDKEDIIRVKIIRKREIDTLGVRNNFE